MPRRSFSVLETGHIGMVPVDAGIYPAGWDIQALFSLLPSDSSARGNSNFVDEEVPRLPLQVSSGRET